ncbi:MAG: CARDB domain-containing protein [Candidatus Omnitrophota bacterium]
MRKNILSLILAITVLFLNGTSFAQTLRINNKEVEEGQTLNLFFDDLEQGKIFFSLKDNHLNKAQISFDKGRTWQEMEREKDYFIFGYRPLLEDRFIPEFLLTYDNGSMRTYTPDVVINYQKKRPQEALEQVLEKMKIYYEQENIDRFIDLFSATYPDRVKFKEAIQNDFYNYKNIRLRYRIDRRTFDEDYTGAIWDVYWERKYDDREGSSFSDSANIAMRFVKEGHQWLISGLRNNTIFGSTLLACVDLKITSADISGSYVGGDYVVSAVIHNLSSTSASNFKVRFKESSSTFDDTVDVTNISANSQTTVNYTTPSIIPPFTVTVTVDSTNVLNECNRSNNSATKNF